MGKRLNFWPLAGFLTVSALGTLAHFAYEWSGKQLLAGAFCAVNESTWEHMKLLFFPALLFTAVPVFIHIQLQTHKYLVRVKRSISARYFYPDLCADLLYVPRIPEVESAVII